MPRPAQKLRADPPPHPTQAGLFYKLKAASGDRFENEVRFFERVGEAFAAMEAGEVTRTVLMFD